MCPVQWDMAPVQLNWSTVFNYFLAAHTLYIEYTRHTPHPSRKQLRERERGREEFTQTSMLLNMRNSQTPHGKERASSDYRARTDYTAGEKARKAPHVWRGTSLRDLPLRHARRLVPLRSATRQGLAQAVGGNRGAGGVATNAHNMCPRRRRLPPPSRLAVRRMRPRPSRHSPRPRRSRS